MSDSQSNENRVVVITGCTSGIGLETAILCGQKGHTVYATVRNYTRSTHLKERIRECGLTNVSVLEMDVSSTNSIDHAVAEIIKKNSNIDVLFNNAGFMVMGSLEDLTVNEIRSQIDADLMGPIYLTKNVIPHMGRDSRGLIVNMSSVAGKIGFPLSSAYCVSKFGIEGLTEALRREVGSRNINVCLVEAGIVNTNFFDNIRIANRSYKSRYARETQDMKSLVDKIKKEKWSDPKEVAAVVTGLIGKETVECRYVVGSDAMYLVDVLHHSRGDCGTMDRAIDKIMARYLE